MSSPLSSLTPGALPTPYAVFTILSCWKFPEHHQFSLTGKLLCILYPCLEHLFSSVSCLSLAPSYSILSLIALVWMRRLGSGLPLHADTGFLVPPPFIFHLFILLLHCEPLKCLAHFCLCHL